MTLTNSFHSATFALLGRPLLRSPESEVAIAEAERRIGLELPASVREWYGYGGAVEVLAKYSNDDPPIAVSNFAAVHWKSNPLIPFRNENQGVCMWAILLDGSEDPPVYVDVDSAGREWYELAPTFSTYVRTSTWDHKLVLQRSALAQAQGAPLSPDAADRLSAIFRAESVTRGWPGSTQYRFQGDDFALLIWSSEVQADWFVGSESETALESGLRAISQLNDLGLDFCRVDTT